MNGSNADTSLRFLPRKFVLCIVGRSYVLRIDSTIGIQEFYEIDIRGTKRFPLVKHKSVWWCCSANVQKEAK